jgi:LPXTG-site transpeptidase (sortase) family protein
MRLKFFLLWLLSVAIISEGVYLAIVFAFPNLAFAARAPHSRTVLSDNSQTLQGLLAGRLMVPLQNLYFGVKASPPADQVRYGLPVRLRIPIINVDAALVYVGLTPDGSMAMTKGPNDVAWYEPGTRPGEIGSAVIAGHYGHWKSGADSVFDNLNKLIVGDKIYVDDDAGTTIAFVVREIRTYDDTADASQVFGSVDDKAHLNLVSCSGVWNEAKQSYPTRLVIFTDKE